MQGRTVEEAMEDNSGEDFLELKEYLNWKVNAFDPLNWYIAALTREVVVSRHPKKLKHLKIKDFLLKFVDEERTDVTSNAEQIADRTARSKAYWFGVFRQAPQEPPTNGRT